MLVLGIETSCDETGVAVVGDGKILAEKVISQVDLHSRFGGVVPELASRKHVTNLPVILESLFASAEIGMEDIGAVAVTVTPGLIGALLTGVACAKALSFRAGVPLLPVHHLDAHIQSVFIDNPALEYPFAAFVLSGGHSQISICHGCGNYELVGDTLDDAVGEAFDKVARLLGLGYPGGPLVERLAKNGNPDRVKFPRALIERDTLDFSLSGLKTAVRNFIKNDEEVSQEDICAGFQAAVVDVVMRRMEQVVEKFGVGQFVLCGGVAANKTLREAMEKKAKELSGKLFVPAFRYCMDNGTMIAVAALKNYQAGVITAAPDDLSPDPSLDLNTFFRIYRTNGF